MSVTAKQYEALKADLKFDKSGKGIWASRNNSYVIIKSEGKFTLVHQGHALLRGMTNLKATKKFAANDQFARLYGEPNEPNE